MAGSALLPETIGRFKVESRLGSGGMGAVYKAYDATLQRTVAIKTVRPDIDNPGYLERLYREAQAGARLQHPNIVTVYEAGEVDGLVYIAMEYLKGESLATALSRGDLSFDAKVKVLVQLLEALQYAHGEGVIHRDIKPANIHRLPDGSIKILDFGLARVERADSLTRTGAIVGTPFYASPEQLKSEPVDARTDIYSVGVVAYEIFTGRKAFEGENLTTVMLKVLSSPAPPMETAWTNTFPELERIVTRAMAKEPADRFATAEDMRNALTAFVASARDGLASVHAEQTILAQRAIVEAKNLIAKGAIGQAQELLQLTLRANPEASAVRSLLYDTSMSGIGVKPGAAGSRQDAAPEIVQPTMVRPRSAPAGAVQGSVFQAEGSAANVPPTIVDSALVSGYSAGLPSPDAAAIETPRHGGPDLLRRPMVWAIAASVVVVAAVAFVMLRPAHVQPASSPTARVTEPESTPAPPGNVPPTTLPPADSALAPAAKAETSRSSTPAPTPPKTEGRTSTPETPAPPKSVDVAKTSPVVVPPTPPPAEAGAKKLFVDNAARNAGLRYAVVQQTTTGEVEVDPDTLFRSGDKVRFTFEPNVDGYLYLVQEGSSGKWNMLFPHPQINGGVNTVQRGQKLTIPSQGWFVFDKTPGTERAFVFLSKEPMSQLPGFKQPVTKMESVERPVVDQLRNSVKSRDLVFERERPVESGAGVKRQTTFVVNRDELGLSVSATIQLVHKE